MNVFEGQKGDARQSGAAEVAPQHSLFRKRYRQLEPHEVALHDAIKDKADELAALIASVSPVGPASPGILGNVATNRGANITLALRHLEDAVYRAVKALTA